MKIYLTRMCIVLTFLLSHNLYAQDTITTEDLTAILGEWTGTLTYTDYGTNKPFSMPANLLVKPGKNDYQVQLLITYPKEPNANSKEKIKISKDGFKLNKIEIISREVLANGQVQITTEYTGKDNNKEALIRTIYILGPENFSNRKEVKFANSDDWLLRNEYKFVR